MGKCMCLYNAMQIIDRVMYTEDQQLYLDRIMYTEDQQLYLIVTYNKRLEIQYMIFYSAIFSKLYSS